MNINGILERILSIMDYYKVSSIQFSQETDIPPATISNLKNKKTKPTLDIVDKIIKRYQEIDEIWLLTGSGNMLKSSNKKNDVNIINNENKNLLNSLFPEENILVNKNIVENAKKMEQKPQQDEKVKVIERIIIYYNDKTYEEYRVSKTE